MFVLSIGIGWAFFLIVSASESHQIQKFNMESGQEESINVLSFPRDVRDWEVNHVANWARAVLEFPFLVPVIEEYRLDGLTLLSLTVDDIQKAFQAENLLIQRKIGAHIRVLQGHCACRSSSITERDFFQYYQRTQMQTWVVFITSFFTPRITLYKIGKEALQNFQTKPSTDHATMQGHESYSWGPQNFNQKWLSIVIYHIALLFFPQIYFVYLASNWAKTNYLVFLIYAITQVTIQFQEYRLIREMFKSTSRERLWVFVTWLFPMVISIAVYGINMILPSVVKDFVLYLVFLLQIIHIVATTLGELGYNLPKRST